MLKEQLNLMKKAYECYFSNQREDIDKNILKCVKELVIQNEDIIKKLIEMYKEKFVINDIYQIIDEALESEDIYKVKKVYKKREDGFVHGMYTTSVGIIAIECSDTLKVLKYLAYGIKSRNAIAISDIEFDETSIKSAFLVFFCEALEKFDLDKNLFMLLPFEECYYDKFDRVIYGDSEKEKVESRIQKDAYYIYLEEKALQNEVQKEIEKLEQSKKEYYVLTDDFYESVSKINESFNKGVAIYTRNPELGYKFINLIHSDNVFVNTTLEAVENIEKFENPLYMNKNIMYQLDRNNLSLISEDSNEEKNGKQTSEIGKTNINNDIKEEKTEVQNKENTLTIPEENIWYKRIIKKIKEILKNI